MQTVRVGVIGTSWWSEFMFLKNLERHPNARLVALCGRNEARAGELARTYGIPHVHTDYRELVTRGDLDAVIVGAPDDQHHAMTMAAVQAGKHVLCEKPLALNAAHAEQMYRAARERNVKHMVLFTQRWLPHVRYVHDLLRSGFVGQPQQAHFTFLMGYFASEQYFWRFDANRANGVLADLGSHMIDLARLFLGEVREVSAQTASTVQRVSPDDTPVTPANDTASLLLGMESGAHATIQLSAVMQLAGTARGQLLLAGSEGTVEVTITHAGEGNTLSLWGARRGDSAPAALEIPPVYWEGTDGRSAMSVFGVQSAGPRAFVDAILSDEAATPGFDVGVKVQAVVDAALESSRTGRQVRLTEAQPA